MSEHQHPDQATQRVGIMNRNSQSDEAPSSKVGTSAVRRGALQCEHVKEDHRRCGAAAMAQSRYCYFHDGANSAKKKKRPEHSYVSDLGDSRSIQMAVTKVCQGVADKSLDSKTGTSLLYGLQVALNAFSKSASKWRK